MKKKFSYINNYSANYHKSQESNVGYRDFHHNCDRTLERSPLNEFKYSHNKWGKDKNFRGDYFTNKFECVTGTVEDFKKDVLRGYAVSGFQLNGKRCKANVVGVQALLIDVDEGLTIEKAIKNTFVKKYCGLSYTTPSHKPEHHKFRLVFVLPEQISGEIYEALYEHLEEKVLKEFPHDKACKDSSRGFYGNSKGEILIYEPDKVLDSSFIEAAEAEAKENRAIAQERKRKTKKAQIKRRKRWKSSGRSDRDLESLVTDALSYIPIRKRGSNNYYDWFPILTGLRNEFGGEKGTAICEEFSPTSAIDNWFPETKDTPNTDISIGVVFGIARNYGWEFPDRKTKQIFEQEYRDSLTIKEILGKFGKGLSQSKKRLNNWGFSKEEKKTREIASSKPKYYPEGDRLKEWQKTPKKLILDSSGTGSGKSYDAGRTNPENWGAKQCFYITTDPRNPSTETLKEDWKNLQGRHDGLKTNEHGQIRVAKKSDDRDSIVIEKNCTQVELITRLNEKNFDNTYASTSVCPTCPQYHGCKSVIPANLNSPNINYLGQREKALKQPKVISHPQSLPPAKAYDYRDSVVIFEEGQESFKISKDIRVSRDDVDEMIRYLMLNHNEIFQIVQQFLREISLMFAEKPPSRYGWSHEDIISRCKEKITDINLLELDKIKSEIIPAEGNKDDLDNLPKMWLVPFLGMLILKDKSQQATFPDIYQALYPDIGSHIQKTGNDFTITIRNDHLLSIVKAAKKVIFLDATWDIEELGAILKVQTSEICHMASQPKKGANLKIVQVAGMGRLGKQRGNQQLRQVQAVTATLKEKHSQIKKITYKDFAEEGNYSWFVDSRGINDLDHELALIVEGVPCPNLNALKAEFSAIFGRVPSGETVKTKYEVQIINSDKLPKKGSPYLQINESSDREFANFVRRRTLANIHQALGRLRASRRPGENLTIYFLGDYPLDTPVELVKASDITPEAASRFEKFETALKGAIAQLKSEGKKVTQTAVSQITGYSQQYISRFKKLLLLLIDSLNSKSSKNSEPDEDVGWMAKSFLPLAEKKELIEEVLNFQEKLGDEEAIKLFDLLDPKTLKLLLEGLLETQPDSLVCQIEEGLV